MSDKKLSAEDQKALDAALATIKRLQGEQPPPDPAYGPPVLRRFRVLLDGVTWDEKTRKYRDNTCRATVHDPKTGRPREVTIDRAVVEAYNEADAWEKFRKSWGIRTSDHTPSFVEVRSLTEAERLAPPAGVIEPEPNVMVGVPPPKVLPIRADGEFNRPVAPPNAAVG
jgi:hypothetical protein